MRKGGQALARLQVCRCAALGMLRAAAMIAASSSASSPPPHVVHRSNATNHNHHALPQNNNSLAGTSGSTAAHLHAAAAADILATSATNAALLTARDAPLVVEGMGVTSALVCINAFATYSSERAANLREVILTVKSWQIKHIRIVVSTQDEKALRWQIGDDVKWVEIYAVPDADLRAANGPAPGDDHGVMLAWTHRHIITEKVRDHKFGLVVYLENDMKMSWHTLLSWAADEELLRAATSLDTAGTVLQRGFWRYELCAQNGDRDVHVRAPSKCMAEPCDFGKHVIQGSAAERWERWPCKFNVSGRMFVGMDVPYPAAWVMGPLRLQAFMQSSHWLPDNGTRHQCRPGEVSHGLKVNCNIAWGIMESAAVGDSFLNAMPLKQRKRCTSRAVVPYVIDSAGVPALDTAAGLHHLGQNHERIQNKETLYPVDGCPPVERDESSPPPPPPTHKKATPSTSRGSRSPPPPPPSQRQRLRTIMSWLG